MTGRFTGLGFDTTGILTVEASCRVRQQKVARFDLGADVPDDVREHFDRIRTLHVYGAFYYGFFTLVTSLVALAVELALKARLREVYPAEAALIDDEDLTKLWHRARRSGILAHRSAEEFQSALQGYLDPMFWVGREKGAFPIDRYDYETIRRLRNYAAHPSRSDTLMPPDSARHIQWLACLTNSLWEPVSPLPLAKVERLADTITRVVWTADQGHPTKDLGARYGVSVEQGMSPRRTKLAMLGTNQARIVSNSLPDKQHGG